MVLQSVIVGLRARVNTFKSYIIGIEWKSALNSAGVIVVSCVGLDERSNCDRTFRQAGDSPLICVAACWALCNTGSRGVVGEEKLIDWTLFNTFSG